MQVNILKHKNFTSKLVKSAIIELAFTRSISKYSTN